jgi:hypothetical protein
MSADYDREIYSYHFARLLNRALKKGAGDAQQALAWLHKSYPLIRTLLWSGHRLEITDAFMDVREHLINRAENKMVEGTEVLE